MQFNPHSNLAGQHAFLSASKYHWINYDEDKMVRFFDNAMAARLGTRKHEFAHMAIELGQKMPNTSATLNRYVNDAIGFKMQSEQILYYSDVCFGTPDTISFRKNLLRIHDLKTGAGRVSMKQLMVYDALFCLEYKYKPHTIKHELRIYQNDDVEIYEPDPHDILQIMSKIIAFDKIIVARQMEVFQ